MALNGLVWKLEKLAYYIALFPTSDLCLPDFLGIGAQKAGTTWLHEMLKCHPDLYLPDEKELHYFDWHFNRSLRSYAERFKPGLGKVKGEITPGYSIISRRRIRFIRGVMPDVKLLFIMRNPVERAWSQALMNLVTLPNRRVKNVDDREFFSHFVHHRSLRRGDYVGILDNWLSIFPREQLYLGFFEDIIECPEQMLTEIFAHIGVNQDINWEQFPTRDIVSKGPSVPIPAKFRIFLEDMYQKDLEIMSAKFGRRAASWISS